MKRSGGGGASRATGAVPYSGCFQTNCPFSQRSSIAPALRSETFTLCGAASVESTPMTTNTPQRAPLATMLFSRCTAVSVKFAGKLAITSTRNGSAILPAKAL